MKSAKLSDADDAEAPRVAVPEKDRGDGGPGQPNQPETRDRHALARLAEGLSQHGRGARQRHDHDRNDGSVISHRASPGSGSGL